MPAGRPTKYSPDLCETVEALLGKGHSLTGAAGKMGVVKATLQNWCEEHPEFLAAVKRGQAAAVAYWEDLAVNNAITGDGNATTIIFGLKNRARDDWRDKQEIENSGTTTTRIERVIVNTDD